MKSNNYTKPLLVLLTLFLTVSIFFNLRDVLLAQAPNRALKSLLTNYVGKQVSFAKDEKGVLKEVNTDNIVIEQSYGEGGTRVMTYVLPFEAIKMIKIGQQDYINIMLGL